ncbi:MAG: PilZ domain-containing protein [Sphingomonas sp.]|uniref:PilZ domain-containing protein n=1 Tax=Sphingomonas sp. TaxID=28214 RepID=UPI001ACEFFBF|nr:PilZ domain-containing protein [Sphingomonas sp.]MBN8816490.1 PilZ domain-containing protein [Sphingomonas sp.]
MNAHVFGIDAPVATRDDNRRQPRHEVVLRARLRNRATAKFDIRIIDMSVTGFRAEAHYGLNVGDIVWIKLPGLQGLEANIAWRHKEIVGGHFRQPLHPAVLDHLIANGARY